MTYCNLTNDDRPMFMILKNKSHSQFLISSKFESDDLLGKCTILGVETQGENARMKWGPRQRVAGVVVVGASRTGWKMRSVESVVNVESVKSGIGDGTVGLGE
jgi:hypothetical protein